MSPPDFFMTLRNRISTDPGPDFDRDFWRRLEQESRAKAPDWGSIARDWLAAGWWRPVGLAASAAAVAAALLWAPLDRRGSIEILQDAELFAQTEEIETEAKDLDLFATLDDVDLSDEEWKLLLEGRGAESEDAV